MEWMAVVIRVLHIGAAVAAAGAAFFQWRAVHPSLAVLAPEQRVAVRGEIARRWFPIVAVLIGLLLLTGLLNFLMFKIPEYKPHPQKGLYHGLFGLKFLLGLASFHFAAALSLPGPRGERWRENAGRWLGVLVVLMLAIIVLGAVLRHFRDLFPG